MSNNETSLLQNQQKKFNDAFVDFSYLENPQVKNKN